MMSVNPTYLAHEEDYRLLDSQFLASGVPVITFIDDYLALWKQDRDAPWARVERHGNVSEDEVRLSTVLNRIFTACDAFDDAAGAHAISEAELREEVAELARQRWPSTTI